MRQEMRGAIGRVEEALKASKGMAMIISVRHFYPATFNSQSRIWLSEWVWPTCQNTRLEPSA
jgi:hypothetical protein